MRSCATQDRPNARRKPRPRMVGEALAFQGDVELVAVRHGRTAWNADGRFQGQTDVPLDAIGRAQARALAALLAPETFDAAIASDLSRARETAEIVLGTRPVTLENDPRWREMQFGAWEGLTWNEIVARHPEAAGNAPRFATPPGGESFDELCARVGSALHGLAARFTHPARVLVVTHAGVLHALVRVALGESESDALAVRFAPATVTRLLLGPSGNRVLELNRSAAADRSA